jgi:hypothetical protein
MHSIDIFAKTCDNANVVQLNKSCQRVTIHSWLGVYEKLFRISRV